jgi:hypothetical protein
VLRLLMCYIERHSFIRVIVSQSFNKDEVLLFKGAFTIGQMSVCQMT